MTLKFAAASSIFCLGVILLPSVARGQSPSVNVDPSDATGTSSYVTYGGVRENISLATGNLNLQIPLLTVPGRNGQNLSLALEYDSKMWTPSYYWNPNTMRNVVFWNYEWPTAHVTSSHWRLGLPILQTNIYDYGPNGAAQHQFCAEDFMITMPDSSKLSFGNRTACNLTGPGSNIQPNPSLNINVTDTVDGTFYRLDTTDPGHMILYSKGGTQYHFLTSLTYTNVVTNVSGGYFKAADRIEDTNGNWITISSTNLAFRPDHKQYFRLTRADCQLQRGAGRLHFIQGF
jgi:hypothetical protein